MATRPRLSLARAGLLACASLFLAATALRAQAPVHWDPDERVVIGSLAHILAVANDGWSIHAATLGGLITYDPAARRWESPLTLEDGYPVQERPTALVALRGEQTLVLGTALGTIWRVDPAGRRFERLAAMPGPVQRLVAGDLGALFVLTSRGWYELPAGSFFPQPIPGEPAGPRERLDPRIGALSARIGLDARLRRWPLTSVAPGLRPDEYFVGTAGGGLFRVDALTHEVQPLPYGLASLGVRSVLVAEGRVWFGGDGTAREGANVASADTALQLWEWPGGPGDALPRGSVSAMAWQAGSVWFGADDGLFRHDLARRSWERHDDRAGLPGRHVTALLAVDSVLWVGTDRGACAWLGAACSSPVLAGTRITALAACAGALWVGSDRGLVRLSADHAPAPADHPELARQPTAALACLDDTLAAATAGRLYLGGTSAWREQPQAGTRGRIRGLAADGGVLWVAADGGLARRGAGAGEWTYYIVPGDVPLAPVGSMAAVGRHLWLATRGGAVWLDLRR